MNLDHRQAAQILCEHWRAGTALDNLPAGLRPTTRAQGHAIQALLPEVAGRSVVGWKIAATSKAGQAHINVSGPLAGRMLSGEVDDDGATISLRGNRMRVAEPEIAFRFSRELAPRTEPFEVSDVLAAVDAVVPAFEVPNSRFAEFARAGEAQLQADNACCGRFVIGTPADVDWRALDLRALQVHARVMNPNVGETNVGDTNVVDKNVGNPNGLRFERRGDGSAALGDARVALTWLANELRGLGLSLRAGDVVSTGTCMVPLEVQPGDTVHADFGVLGKLTVRIGA